MKATKAALMLVAGTAGQVPPAGAQTTIGADMALLSSYIWRGLSLTNKPVAQPDIYVTIPAGNAAIVLGTWTNIDLGKYDDPNEDIRNGLSFVPWAEVQVPAGKTTLTGGVTAYLYPDDFSLASDVGPNTNLSTMELYGKTQFDVPLSPTLAIYYDVIKFNGAYLEGSVSHTLTLSETRSLTLGALAGFSAGQNVNSDPASHDLANFLENGLTHVDLSAGSAIAVGPLAIIPAFHFIINADENTRVISPSDLDQRVKIWLGATISWVRARGD